MGHMTNVLADFGHGSTCLPTYLHCNGHLLAEPWQVSIFHSEVKIIHKQNYQILLFKSLSCHMDIETHRFLLCVVYCCAVSVGFKSFDSHDQATIIRLGQSASRVVLAAVHWYDVDLKLFRNFLAWRSSSQPSAIDLFKQQLMDYAESICSLDVDPIEAALLNSLLIIATGMFIF